MSDTGAIPIRSGISAYEHSANELFASLRAGDAAAAWRFKWDHPAFKNAGVEAVREASLDVADAKTVIAREHSFNSWQELENFVRSLSADGDLVQFEEAVEAVISGNAGELRRILSENPALVRARSARRHHATLLHYLGANGVESGRQKTPANALEIAEILLDAGAEPDALADLYDNKCTTMSMVVTSAHPAKARLQAPLAELLADHGAALNGAGTKWQSPVLAALMFGYLDTARALARRAPLDFRMLAGLGRLDEVRRLLPTADAESRQDALSLAAQHGHAEIVRLLLDAGEDPNRYNREGYHAHSTPLHQAVWSNQIEVVKTLVERGARLDTKDKIYDATPLDWAVYGQREAIADYLRTISGS